MKNEIYIFKHKIKHNLSPRMKQPFPKFPVQ